MDGKFLRPMLRAVIVDRGDLKILTARPVSHLICLL